MVALASSIIKVTRSSAKECALGCLLGVGGARTGPDRNEVKNPRLTRRPAAYLSQSSNSKRLARTASACCF